VGKHIAAAMDGGTSGDVVEPAGAHGQQPSHPSMIARKVRFALESGHAQRRHRCRLSAISRLEAGLRPLRDNNKVEMDSARFSSTSIGNLRGLVI